MRPPCRRTSVRSAGRPRKPIAAGSLRQLGEAHWEFRIARELKSPNKTLWAHWRLKQAERQAWEETLLMAVSRYGGMETVAGVQFLKSLSVFVDPARKERRRIVLTRIVPSVRNFVKDEDNLAFSGKHLFDAMKRVGMISDDTRELLDAPRPTQVVSADGAYLTVIELQRLAYVAPSPSTSTKRRATAAGAGDLYAQSE